MEWYKRTTGGKKENTTRLCINNEIITDQKQIANTLNKYFIEIGETLSAKLGIPVNTIDHYQDNPNKDNFYISPTTPEEVLKLINNLDPNKPSDIYNIYPKLVHDSKYLVIYTTFILNLYAILNIS